MVRWLVLLQTLLACNLLLAFGQRGWSWALGRHAPPLPQAARSPIQEVQMRIYVQGRVRRPGDYVLPLGARVLDALLAAGGPLPDANLADLNLVAPLADAATVAIASHKDKSIVSTIKEAISPVSATPETGLRRARLVLADDPPRHGKQLPERKINLNRATAEELTQLPGIGPSMAEDIVAYRLRIGRFKELGELRRIRGLGQKRLKRIKEFVLL